MTVIDRTEPTTRVESEEEMLARAEAAIQEMASNYPDWAMEDVTVLEEIVGALKAGTPRTDDNVKAAFKKAHDMRGQGGSFGYPVITIIANSFCKFSERMEILDQKAIDILAAHAKAMRAVIANRLSGDGGPVAEKLITSLQTAVNKHLGH